MGMFFQRIKLGVFVSWCSIKNRIKLMVDIILLIILAVGFVTGLISGAVKQIVSLVAFVMGFVLASLYYQELGKILAGVLPLPTFCDIVAFVLIWVFVPIVSRLVGTLLTSMLDGLFTMGLLNRLLGGILGMAKYALVLGAFIWLFSMANLIKAETLQESRLCLPLKAVPEFVYNILKTHSHRQSEPPTPQAFTLMMALRRPVGVIAGACPSSGKKMANCPLCNVK